LGEAVSQTAGDIFAVAGKNKRKDWHIRIARWMLVVAAVTGVLWGFTDLITLFVLEGAVFLLFMLFWTVQTFELERERERPRARRPGFLDRFRRRSRSATSTSTDVQGHANL
jgi:fatty acid desaturase